MSEERKLILNLLVEGKITSDEADELLEALEQDASEKQQEPETGTEQAPEEPGEGPGEEMPGVSSRAKRQRKGVSIGPGLEDRITDMAGEIEELVSDIPERMQKALEGISITKDGKKSNLAELLNSLGLSEIGGASATPKFRMGTSEVKDRLPVSVALTNGTARFAVNEENTDIRVISKVVVKNAACEDVQKVASEHIEVFFDPQKGLKVRSIDNKDSYVSGVEVLLPKNLSYDIQARSVNGSVRCGGISAKTTAFSTVNGSVVLDGCKFDSMDSQTINGGIRMTGEFRDASASTVNGSIRGTLVLLGGNMKLSSNNGTIKVAIDKVRSVPMQIQASSRHGSVRMEDIEGFDTITEPSSQSMHKTGLWRSRSYHGAKERTELEMETRNGSVIITED
ncbi:MAG TPA: DUF4097 family beta strand repeat-containing protein [Bacillota bacterium]|mgnify:CR=1 FL=1|nr:DUF4097 family beta strand repeat-containing protein [Bacillota bacterium]HPM63551.1 DUF4097 family beta strand repeat-containing protein [Bacillota bacterium]